MRFLPGLVVISVSIAAVACSPGQVDDEMNSREVTLSQTSAPQASRATPPPSPTTSATVTTIAPGTSTAASDPYELLTVAWRDPWASNDWRELVLLSDGRFSGEAEVVSDLLASRVDDDVLARLYAVAREADLDRVRRTLTRARGCRASTDGIDWSLTVMIDGHPRSFNTCEYRLDGTVPVFAAAYEVFGLARPDLAVRLWLTMRPYPPDFTVALMIDGTLLKSEVPQLNEAGRELREMLKTTEGVFAAGLAQSPPNGAERAFGIDSATYERLVADGVEPPWIIVGAADRDAVLTTIELALATDGVLDAFSG